jgi:hypothetical protein
MLKCFRIVTIVTAVFAGAVAQANDVYIDQIGDSTTISITQDGSSNRVGADGTPSIIIGDANIVTIDQIGSSNTLDLVVNGTAVTTVVTTNGNYNTQTINCGTYNSATCGSSIIKQEVTGDNNNITQNLIADATQRSEILVTGDYNTVTHATSGSGAHSGIITVTGGIALDGNVISLTQGGTNAQQATITSTGNSNVITVNQYN